MSNQYSFSVMPSVSISRSKFLRKSQHKTSWKIGKIVPIYVDEVLPGDTRSLNVSSLVRMSTPIAPIMDNVHMDIFAFFVPNRLTWEHWKEFMGENTASAGAGIAYSVPQLVPTTAPEIGSIWDYFGLPLIANVSVSALPFRAYFLIYNRFFRNQNLIAPMGISIADGNGVGTGGTALGIYESNTRTASKDADYFVSCLPYAQKGSPVSIPIGSTAPVKLIQNGGAGLSTGWTDLYADISGTSPSQSAALFSDGVNTNVPFKMIADLSNATAATINQLRYAFQLQKMLEKDALYGTRYWEILAAHFGVTSPDASLQDPEYLGGKRIHINVDQVLSTAGYDDSASTTVGCPGANSVTGDSSALFTKSFTEHGHIIVVAVCRHDQTYGQGVNRMWSRKTRYQYYFPTFANLGAQEVLNKEIYAQGTSADDLTFGYQEAWAEYRYKPSICTGLLNPARSGSLDYWTLANNFASLPTLSQSFIEQNRDNIARALVTGSNANMPDFIGDFYFIDEAVRPMPMYSIPGLIDHH